MTNGSITNDNGQGSRKTDYSESGSWVLKDGH